MPSAGSPSKSTCTTVPGANSGRRRRSAPSSRSQHHPEGVYLDLLALSSNSQQKWFVPKVEQFRVSLVHYTHQLLTGPRRLGSAVLTPLRVSLGGPLEKDPQTFLAPTPSIFEMEVGQEPALLMLQSRWAERFHRFKGYSYMTTRIHIPSQKVLGPSWHLHNPYIRLHQSVSNHLLRGL